MHTIDINCDMGESTMLWPYEINNDIQLLDFVSSINLACWEHAGDEETSKLLMDEAIERNIGIGAHPSYPDRQNFGRSAMEMETGQLFDSIAMQIERLNHLAFSSGTQLNHVKPHGALYNEAAKDYELAYTVCAAIQSVNPMLIIYGLSGSEIINAANDLGMQSCSEVFCDRTYQPDGQLTPRKQHGALIPSEDRSVAQALQMIIKKTVTTIEGIPIPVTPETICIHSDTENALEFAEAIYSVLSEKGIEIHHPQRIFS